MKYRIKQKQKKGHYNFYTVQSRKWWWFGWRGERSFTNLEQCQSYIEDQSVQEKITYHKVKS